MGSDLIVRHISVRSTDVFGIPRIIRVAAIFFFVPVRDLLTVAQVLDAVDKLRVYCIDHNVDC